MGKEILSWGRVGDGIDGKSLVPYFFNFGLNY